MHSLAFQSSKGTGAFVSSRDVMKPGWMDGDGSSSEEQPEISLKEMFETEMARNTLFVFVGFFVVGFVLLVLLLLFVFGFLRKESFFSISV